MWRLFLKESAVFSSVVNLICDFHLFALISACSVLVFSLCLFWFSPFCAVSSTCDVVSRSCSCSARGVDTACYLSVHKGELFSPEGELAEGVTAGEITGTAALQEREDVIHHLTQAHVPAQVNHSRHTRSYQAFNHTGTQSVAVLTEGVTN